MQYERFSKDQEIAYDEFKETLVRIYGSNEASIAKLNDEFSKRTQRPNETIAMFATALRQLGRRAYEGWQSDEHLDMLMICHHLDSNLPEDIAFAKSRIRSETISAEGVLHDIGAISMTSSDSQAMGRIGEIVKRTWQTADKMKNQRGPLKEDHSKNDNFRVKRYISKYTINPAITHGISEYVGSIHVGKMADLVIWKPSFFGAKPELVIKGGMIAYASVGDPNATIPTPQPFMYRKMFGFFEPKISSVFIPINAINSCFFEKNEIKKQIKVVRGCRSISKKNMILNEKTPNVEIDPKTYNGYINGEKIISQPSDILR